jgi:membrane protein involved in colicin uptake
MNKYIAVVLLLVFAAGCAGTRQDGTLVPPLDPKRKVSEEDCTRPFDTEGGNLLCRNITEAERRAMIEEQERQARAKKEAAERAERERLERERAEQAAREEAARKQREAEEARLAAERRRQEEEAARKAEEARLAAEAAAAAALARQRAEQEAREAAARECRRLEQERSEGREMLANFLAKYGQDAEFKGIAGQIAAFLAKPSKAKPCPPA